MQKRHYLRYGVEDIPPIAVTLTSALQHTVMSMGGVLSVVIIISDLVCAEDDDPIRSQLFSTSLFMVGIGTIVNTAFGIRLPVFQGPSSTFLVPLLALRSTGEWTCPSKIQQGYNTTSNYSEVVEERKTLQYSRLTELQGSLMLSSLFEVITGSTGLIGVLMRYIGPITMSVTITLIGLGLYEIPIYFFRAHMGISGFSLFLMIVFSLYLDHIQIPLPRLKKGTNKTKSKFPLFQTFPVLLSLGLSWALCGILTVSGVLSNDPESSDYPARTDTRFKIIEDTPWFYFPYPGQFGYPRFNPAVFVGFLVAVINSAFESIGDYHATAKACQVSPPPNHAINRGIFVEGIMSVISGALGAGHATTTYSNHVAIISLTKIASRTVLIVSGVMALIVSVLSKIGAVFTIIPDPAIGGSAFVSLGLVTSLGISLLQKVDLNSSRNLAIIGISIYAGVVFPEWVKQYPAEISLGNSQADQIVKVLLGTPMFLGSTVAFILDNTVKGTLSERGMISKQITPDDTEIEMVICNRADDDAIDPKTDSETKEYFNGIEINVPKRIKNSSEDVYKLPYVDILQSKVKCFRHIPFLQSYAPNEEETPKSSRE